MIAAAKAASQESVLQGKSRRLGAYNATGGVWPSDMWQPADCITQEPCEISLRQVVQMCLCLSGATEEAMRQTRQGTAFQSIVLLEQLRESIWLFSNGCVPPGHFYALALADSNAWIANRIAGWSAAWRAEYAKAWGACRTFLANRGVFPRTMTTHAAAVRGVVDRVDATSAPPRRAGRPIMYYAGVLLT